jgi:putative ABC transport system permease protein
MTTEAKKPPRITGWILSRMKGYNEEFMWAGDIEEEFKEKAASKGICAARCWYRHQVLKTIPSYTKYLINWSLIMLRHYSITAWRHLKRQKTYSIINIAGLALGITFFILIMLYIQYELSFDRDNQKARRIYRVAKVLPPGHTHGGKTMMVNTTPPLASTLVAEFPEVESATRFCRRRNVLLTYNKNHFLEEEVFFTDPQVFDIFSISLVAGNSRTALTDPHSIILSQSDRNPEKHAPKLPLHHGYHHSVRNIRDHHPSGSERLAEQFLCDLHSYGGRIASGCAGTEDSGIVPKVC